MTYTPYFIALKDSRYPVLENYVPETNHTSRRTEMNQQTP